MGNRFLKGAMILSISMFATKFLGILYVIPFQQLVGTSGMALYNYAYTPYALFISLSTLGIPVGIAKFVSKYNAAGEYDTARKMFRYAIWFMIALGIIGFLTMYNLAPWYAQVVLGGEEALANTVEDVTMAIQTISFALLIIPVMAIFRGFFQGNQNMVPTSVSQFVEQVVRIIFILAGSYYIINIQGGTTKEAVGFSVFSAFLAGITAFLILYYYWIKNVKQYNQLLKQSVPHEPRNYGNLFAELISYAIPFAILGLATNLFQIVDQTTYNHYMLLSGLNGVLVEDSYGMYAGSLYKIIMIPVSFAISFGQPLIPELTHHLTAGNLKAVRKNLVLAIQLTCFITVPAVVGMALLSEPIYIMFFNSATPGYNQMGGDIFRLGSLLGLFMALYSIVTAILQGIGKQWYGIIFLVISLVIKYFGNVLLIPIFKTDGATLATMIAYTFCITMSLIIIKRQTGFKVSQLLRRLVAIFVFTGIMAFVVVVVKLVLNLFMDYNAHHLLSYFYVAIAGFIGIIIYFGLAWYFDLITALFGLKFSPKRFKERILRRR
ncbi:MAG: polysaccharide biosynthesis protein [Turicibacter sp.]|nr:polysaccharide biosynthesis protein [Turicibacter sp.]